MPEHDSDLSERTFGRTERTRKAEEHWLARFCRDASLNNKLPEDTRTRAGKLYAEWEKLQRYPDSSPRKRQAKADKAEALYRRMEQFRNENGTSIP